MKYVVVSVVKGSAGDFNNNLRKDVFNKFGAKSSKLPAHFTIKAPFETNDIDSLDITLNSFCKNHSKANYQIKCYGHFDNRVIFMKVLMSENGKMIHDELIESMSKLPFIKFDNHDGKDKIFHVTITSKKIQKIFDDIYNYVNYIPCDFECYFDNISIFKWEDNTWKLHKEYLLK